jgi:nucleotide-binding universal stress UspA family protein
VIENPKLLVPVDASHPDELPLELVELLKPLSIVVLGYYPVPDQTPPEHLRDEYQEEAKAAMEPAVRTFTEQGADVESVLVFTRDRVQSIDRVANEYGCDAVLVPGPASSLEQILVSLQDEANMFRVLEVVRLVMEAGAPEVTLFHAESVEKGSARSELYLRGATDWLTECGLDRERITWKEPTAETQVSDLVDLAADNDFVVMGEHEPGIRERVLGDVPNRVHDSTGRPVLVVRKGR